MFCLRVDTTSYTSLSHLYALSLHISVRSAYFNPLHPYLFIISPSSPLPLPPFSHHLFFFYDYNSSPLIDTLLINLSFLSIHTHIPPPLSSPLLSPPILFSPLLPSSLLHSSLPLSSSALFSPPLFSTLLPCLLLPSLFSSRHVQHKCRACNSLH